MALTQRGLYRGFRFADILFRGRVDFETALEVGVCEVMVFYVPVPDREVALKLGREAVRQGLAACAQVGGEILSIYVWEGCGNEHPEIPLILKTHPNRADALAAWLEAEHPYTCPCIARSVVRTNPAYAAWVAAQTADPQTGSTT